MFRGFSPDQERAINHSDVRLVGKIKEVEGVGWVGGCEGSDGKSQLFSLSKAKYQL